MPLILWHGSRVAPLPVRELHRRYFSELRALIADSKPGEQVLLANVQLVRLA